MGHGDATIDLTADAFLNGRLRVAQSRLGYRFSIDAVLLAHFAHLRGAERVIDLGTGCGIIPLILAFRHAGLRVWGVELQPELAALAAANVRANRMEERVTILHDDMRRLTPAMTGGVMDVVICNPPFRRAGTGRLNPIAQRAVARHEVEIGLAEILKASRRMLKNRGRLVVIQAAERLGELIGQLRVLGVEPKRLRTVHENIAGDAKMVLVEGRPGSGAGMKILPPLCLNEGGSVSAEVRDMLRP
ncbi:MAG: methyltransferase [Desulfobacterales bacterium]